MIQSMAARERREQTREAHLRCSSTFTCECEGDAAEKQLEHPPLVLSFNASLFHQTTRLKSGTNQGQADCMLTAILI